MVSLKFPKVRGMGVNVLVETIDRLKIYYEKLM